VDEVDKLIKRFRASPGDRPWMTDELYLAFPDRRAVAAVIEYAGDPAEDGNGRCQAFKYFHYVPPPGKAEQRRLRAVALRVAASDPDDMARVYAVLALTPFADRADVEAALAPLMTNTEEDSDVRSAAFQTLSRRGHERREELFRALLSDPQLGREVETHFALIAQGQRGPAEPGAAPKNRGGTKRRQGSRSPRRRDR